VVILEPRVFGDSRGYFMESWSQRDFGSAVKPVEFVQDNESKSSYGVIRGLHYQKGKYSQSKLVRVVSGSVLDVAVDIRRGSPWFGRHVACVLSGENHRQLFIPRGFAHGFITLTDDVEVQYKADNYYSPEHDGGVRWDDPEIGVEWPIRPAILSDKDRNAPLLAERAAAGLNFVYDGK
jgi:dTDP-4-dehydrorhamnose 3,5-epimerase